MFYQSTPAKCSGARLPAKCCPAELEQWVYAHDAELEALLPNDVYLDLIALDFADKWALHEIEKLVGAYVQRDSQAYQRFEDGKPARETLRYLRRLAAQPDDTLAFENLLDYTQHFPFLYDLTNELQDWFADGYRTPLLPQKQAQIRALAQGLLDDIAAGRIVFAFTTQGVLFCLDKRQPENRILQQNPNQPSQSRVARFQAAAAHQ